MKIEEFNQIVSQVEKFYDKEIPEEQKKVWYNEFKNTDLRRFQNIVHQAYRINKFMPKLADLIEINSTLGYSQVKKDKDNRIQCKICKNVGFILYTKKTEGIEYTYAAVCKCRKEQQYDGRKVTDARYRSNYYTPYIEQIMNR